MNTTRATTSTTPAAVTAGAGEHLANGEHGRDAEGHKGCAAAEQSCDSAINSDGGDEKSKEEGKEEKEDEGKEDKERGEEEKGEGDDKEEEEEEEDQEEDGGGGDDDNYDDVADPEKILRADPVDLTDPSPRRLRPRQQFVSYRAEKIVPASTATANAATPNTATTKDTCATQQPSSPKATGSEQATKKSKDKGEGEMKDGVAAARTDPRSDGWTKQELKRLQNAVSFAAKIEKPGELVMVDEWMDE